jgi:protein O-mannosyl-transferase
MKKNYKKPIQHQQKVSPAESGKSEFSRNRQETILSLIILFCLPVLLYLQTLSYGLVSFDDDSLITNNISFLSDLHNAPQAFLTDAFTDRSSHFYRPMQTLSYMLDINLSGENSTWMFHLTNILFLGLIAVVLFLLLRKFLIPVRLALLSTLVYCAHPLFVSNVAWIPARGDLQLMLFSLLSFLFFIEFIEKKKLIYLFLNCIAFAAALFSKETAAILPLLFILYYFTFSVENRYDKRFLLNIALLAVSGIFWFWMRSKAIGDFSNRNEMLGVFSKNGEVGLIPFLLNLQTIPESLANFFLPFNVDALPNFSLVKTLIGSGLLILIGLLLFRKSDRSLKEKLFGLSWFLLLLLPTMLFKPSFIDYLHHRFFLPMFGIMLFVLFIIPAKWFNKGNIKNSWIIIAVFIVLSSFTFIKSRSYSDPMTFYNSAISENPKSDFAYIHRGYLFQSDGKSENALNDFSKAIEINPKYAEAYNNRGIIYGNQGLYENAIADYSKAIELKPGIAEAYNNRGLAYGNLGMYDKAIADYSKVIEINPAIAEAYNNLGMAYGNQGIYDKAIAGFTKAINLKPDYGQAYNNRGIAYYRQGQLDKSCADFKKAEELGFDGAKDNVTRLCQ